MKDLTDGKLDEALKYAKSIKDDSLQKCLDRIKHYEDEHKKVNNDIETDIMTDFAPSFYFVRYNTVTESFISDGGIIFHGKRDNGGNGSSPTFSVNLTPTNGWAIHT